MKTRTILIALVLFGLFFVGRGITGFVVSQSCCTGENCSIENQCNFNQEYLDYQMQNILFGMVVLLLAIIFWLKNHRPVN